MSGGRTCSCVSPLSASCPGPFTGRSGHYVQHSVEVSTEAPVPVALALDELYEALLLQEVQVTLYGPGASGEPSGQGLHTRPAQASLVVGVVCEGAVGGDHLRGDPRQDQVVDLGYPGKPRTHRHGQPPRVVRRVRSGDL